MSKLTRTEQIVFIGLGLLLFTGVMIYGLRKYSQKEIAISNFYSEVEKSIKNKNGRKDLGSFQEKEIITIHIAGAVKNPGVYEIRQGSRIYEVINIAGGASSTANLDAINLAEKITEDGKKIIVPEKIMGPQNLAGTSSSNLSSNLININTADEKRLCELPGIGPKTAQKIIEYRTNFRTFNKIEDIKNVPGIGEGKFSQIKDLITVE